MYVANMWATVADLLPCNTFLWFGLFRIHGLKSMLFYSCHDEKYNSNFNPQEYQLEIKHSNPGSGESILVIFVEKGGEIEICIK